MPPSGAGFVRAVDNPWFPLRPGATFVYRGVKDGEPTRDVVHVTRATTRDRRRPLHRCDGPALRIAATSRSGRPTGTRRTAKGTVWYFGEDTAELDATGKVTSREGSWLSGVNGARAGVFMPAHPRVGQAFRQEYLEGHAEDHFRVLDLHASARTPCGRLAGARC